MLFASALVICGLLIVLYRRYVPLSGLQQMKCSELHQAQDACPELKMLDVRDVSEFTPDPKQGSINISLGRLSYVWQMELDPKDHVVIVTPRRSEGYLAARKLKKAGFTSLFYLQEDCGTCHAMQHTSVRS
ncbi:hypothetical protein JCM10914A_42560 [Paenibacillus sp. JCM 10914]|uniref:rhodanese-like domain-containing protein n=1 Tax=Paenibacillus sp. JCM 10914 TaxID=1236974 RepID=UPI0003CC8F94|nr:rhodanese-like domain-containing protein [Paenibacillus sp. JCM 10914]GAE05473.1 hypothetical protein JCM10914_1576 [Paenibacillus sp. JCM 10914]